VKRTPIKRRASIARRTRLARKPLWSRRKPKTAGAIATEIWRTDLGPCVVCPHEGGECSGPIQGHHIVAKQTLKRRGLILHLLDRRNRLSVCEFRHEQHTTGYKPIPRAVLPASVFDFAAEFNLGWYLDKHYPRAAVA
jgi:hypothetical protein